MRWNQVLLRLLGIERAVVEAVELTEDDSCLVVHARPRMRDSRRCPHCGKRCPAYDRGRGASSVRALDLGTWKAYVKSPGTRVECPEHGVVTAAVPWARPCSRFTRAFENTVAWLAARVDRTAVTEYMRVAWRTVGAIIERVTADAAAGRDRLDGLRRIGIDEISYRKGHKYIVVVVDHDTGRLVWAKPGRKKDTVRSFFEELGPQRCAKIELVSADGAEWIHDPVDEYSPHAEVCLDPFHVVQWATDALDKVRRSLWSALRRSGKKAEALSLQRGRYALWKNPENLSEAQQAKLSSIQKTNRPLFRAYLLKEQLRGAIQQKGQA